MAGSGVREAARHGRPARGPMSLCHTHRPAGTMLARSLLCRLWHRAALAARTWARPGAKAASLSASSTCSLRRRSSAVDCRFLASFMSTCAAAAVGRILVELAGPPVLACSACTATFQTYVLRECDIICRPLLLSHASSRPWNLRLT